VGLGGAGGGNNNLGGTLGFVAEGLGFL